MNKFLLTATLATALVGFAGAAHADMGIPDIAAQPLTTQTANGVMGQAMPTFNGPAHAVVSEQFAQNAVGEKAPTFVAPTENGTNGVAYAQIGRMQTVAPVALAGNNQVLQPKG